jgi:hypothetical protein
MWGKLGVVGGVVLVAISWFWRSRQKKAKTIDVGSVSETWLAEHRGRTSDT